MFTKRKIVMLSKKNAGNVSLELQNGEKGLENPSAWCDVKAQIPKPPE